MQNRNKTIRRLSDKLVLSSFALTVSYGPAPCHSLKSHSLLHNVHTQSHDFCISVTCPLFILIVHDCTYWDWRLLFIRSEYIISISQFSLNFFLSRHRRSFFLLHPKQYEKWKNVFSFFISCRMLQKVKHGVCWEKINQYLSLILATWGAKILALEL